MLEIAGETFEETFEERSEEPRGKESVKNWGEEKINWRGGRGNLNASFTYGYKINYYFNLFRRRCVKNPSVNFEFRTKFFNDPPYFEWSVGKSVGNMTRPEMHLMHNPLKFTRSVGNVVDKSDRPTTYRRI
jgi:hypothetical protein